MAVGYELCVDAATMRMEKDAWDKLLRLGLGKARCLRGVFEGWRSYGSGYA